MNKIAIGIVGLIVAVSVFLLMDSEDVATTTKVNTTKENEVKVQEAQSQEVKIEYTQTKELSEKKEEPVVEAKTEVKEVVRKESEVVQKVISEHSLTPIQNAKSDKITFKDSSGKYEAEILVNSLNQRDGNMFPQIPIIANVKLPSGETISTQIDPSLAQSNDKIYIKVFDTQTGEDKIYNISDVASLSSGQKADVTLSGDGAGEKGEIKKEESAETLLPPMPPVN